MVVRHAKGYDLVNVSLPEDGVTSSEEYKYTLGNFTFVRGSTPLVTVDNTGTGRACVAVDGVLMRLKHGLTGGCSDPGAVNYEAGVEEDGSCLYVGGRGVTSRSWSAMNDDFVNDAWYPSYEGSVFANGEFCDVGNAERFNVSDCLHDACDAHTQCGPGAYCCVTDEHQSCNPVWDVELDDDVDSEGWKTIFYHDVTTSVLWEQVPPGLVPFFVHHLKPSTNIHVRYTRARVHTRRVYGTTTTRQTLTVSVCWGALRLSAARVTAILSSRSATPTRVTASVLSGSRGSTPC